LLLVEEDVREQPQFISMSIATSTHPLSMRACQMQGTRLRTSSHPRRIGTQAPPQHPARYVFWAM